MPQWFLVEALAGHLGANRSAAFTAIVWAKDAGAAYIKANRLPGSKHKQVTVRFGLGPNNNDKIAKTIRSHPNFSGYGKTKNRVRNAKNRGIRLQNLSSENPIFDVIDEATTRI